MKEIQKALEEILSIDYLAVPIERRLSISDRTIATAEQTMSHWHVPCSHIYYPPASESELGVLRVGLGNAIPMQLIELLKVTNGAELFRIQYVMHDGHEYWIPRYEIMNCARMIHVNKELLEIFKSYAEFDDNYRNEMDRLKLDYLAFCDVTEGDYLAFNLASPSIQPIFYLDHEYGAYPYADKFAREGYPHVANSLLEWLELLVRTKGQDGLGGKFIPL